MRLPEHPFYDKYPHIRVKVQFLWGTLECRQFIANTLANGGWDEKRGARSGFPQFDPNVSHVAPFEGSGKYRAYRPKKEVNDQINVVFWFQVAGILFVLAIFGH